jgi:hypothetical protein
MASTIWPPSLNTPDLTDMTRKHIARTRANKTDAGNGSNGICRVSNVLRSPSPDPKRSAESNMIGELGELYGWLRAGTAGWRFLFVPSYRQKIISSWKFERWYYIAWDIACGLAGIVFSLLIVVALVYLIADLSTQ